MQGSLTPQDTPVPPRESQAKIHTLPLKTLFEQLQGSEQGLTGDEAQTRQDTYGSNETVGTKRNSGLIQFLRQFLNPLVAILLLAAIVAALHGVIINASIVITIVLLSNVLTFVQTYQSQNAVEKLRAGVAPTATALCDGTWMEIPRRDLVPGDMIRLVAGDLVPADARLVQATDLHVQQAALTGESLPVEKSADDLDAPMESFAEAHNCVFLGTSVVSGTATALVTATGRNTAFGEIAARLASRPPETKFDRGLKGFSLLITQTVFFLILFIFLVGILGHHPPFETVLFAIALAVGLTPEFLPMITTVTLGQGALRMARQKVIVKHLESIQNFGSIDTLCSDKTGISSPLDEAILRHGSRDMTGYSKVGEIPFDFERRCLSVIVRHGDELLLITKGAPESLFPLCSAYELDGGRKALKADGVQVKILTGDNELVTRHVCEKVGLDGGRVVLGSELDHMTDAALSQVVEQVHVFARVSPVQKNRIILALKHRKHVVGYRGDGINDAPSLHAADVGISVSTAADVAKDAASIILLEQSLQVLHNGILEGRKAFGNVIKYLLMGTSSNFGNMFSMAGAYVFLPFLPMLPTQILLNNFLYDLSQITIPTDNVDQSYIKKPHHWDISLIRNFMITIGPVSSIFDFLTFFILLWVFHAGPVLFHTGWFVESLSTQTLVLFIIRTSGNPLPALYFLFLFAMTAIYLLLVQLIKSRVMKRYAQ